VVIPFFKIRYFDKTLKSLASQTNKNFTVYIGNDASLEDPLPLIEKFSTSLNIEYKKFKKNVGSYSLVSQWKRCLNMVEKEEWIMILGDDDVLAENVIEQWYLRFEYFHNKSNLIRFSTQLIDHRNKFLSDSVFHPIWESAEIAFFRKFTHETRSSLSEYIFKKEVYRKYDFHDFELAWHSDDRAWLDFADGNPIYTINSSTVYIRISSESISGQENNLELKKKASIKFYKSVIRDKLHLFTPDQKTDILRKYENLLHSSGLINLKLWLYLFLKFFLIFKLTSFKKFLKRFFKYYLK
jgi:glycosyltransferase involved in cell wall biosynthesis